MVRVAARNTSRLALALVPACFALACATAPPHETPSPAITSAADADEALAASIGEGPWDPFEPMNRGFLMINRGLDYALLDPVSKAYGWLLPEAAKHAVRRVFDNLDSPAVFAIRKKDT